MVSDLLKRAEARKGFFATEKITLIYNLLTSILILFLSQEMGHPVQTPVDRVVVADMMPLLTYLYRSTPRKFPAFIRIAIQMSLLFYWYLDTFEFNRIFPNLGHAFVSAEQWVSGGQLAVRFRLRFPQMQVSEPFNMGYFFYYPMIPLVVVWYFLYRFELSEKVLPVAVTAFFIYYLFYIFVPVAGPQFYLPAIGEEYAARRVFPSIDDHFNHNQELFPGPGYEYGFSYNLVKSSQQVGERPMTAFPSSHVGMSTILMIMVWRGSRRLFAGLLPLYLLLRRATVYIQAHYLINAIVGFSSAIVFYVVATWMFKRQLAQPMLR